MSEDERYIGDGVYAKDDGHGVWLRTPRESGVHEIYLEPLVYLQLKDFYERKWLKHTQECVPGCNACQHIAQSKQGGG